MTLRDEAIERIKTALRNIREEGGEDQAAWEHLDHLEDALENVQAGASNWVELFEDAMGEKL